tara:strand:+ start:873 stop:1502 length:630 start_codon:yes stop_codon:yes gene_type:complete
MTLDKILGIKEPVIVPIETENDGVIWSHKTDTPKHLHPKYGLNPIGIFHSLKEYEYGHANIGSAACSYVFSLHGWIPTFMAQDLERSYDMIIARGDKTYRVQIKSTTQRGATGKTVAKTGGGQTTTERRAKRKVGNTVVHLRANQGKQNVGRKNRPHGYDILFAINELGEFNWWWEEDIKDNKSMVTFGSKNAKEGKLIYEETSNNWDL